MANFDVYYLANTNETHTERQDTYSTSGLAVIGRAADGDEFKCAFRFNNVQVPQGYSINSASLYFFARVEGSGSTNLKFFTYGIDEDNTANFSTAPYSRPKTTAFDSADNPLPGAGNYKQITVTSLVQEIVNRPGWSSGNNMGFMCENNGSDSDVFIEDDQADSILQIRLDAVGDTTPGPFKIGVPGRTPKRNYGMLVSKQGYNADGALEQHIVFNSERDVLKALKSGQLGWPNGSNTESISHQLKYPPAFLTYVKDGGKIHLAPRGFSGSTGEAGGIVAYVDTESIYLGIDPNRDDPDAWYYYVFVDENL